MSIAIRVFTADDYPAVIAVRNAAMPDYQDSVDDWRHWDASRPAHCRLMRYVAEEQGAVVGFGHAVQFSGMYHPRKFFVDLAVCPEQQGRGVGTALYDQLCEALAAHDPLALRCEIRADLTASIQFVAKRGFVEEMRAWESRLDVMSFDPAPYAGQAEKVRARGIEIISLREFMAREPDHRRKLYEAGVEMGRDIPRPDTYTPTAFESWQEMIFNDPNLLPDGYFLALSNGDIAGTSQLWRGSSPTYFNTGLTATRRDYRRLGIALALKLRAIAYAKEQGVGEIRTGNEANNLGMLAINEALGFVKQPIWISFVHVLNKELAPDAY